MSKIYLLIVVSALFYFSNTCLGQVGIFYYPANDNNLPNSQINDIIEDENKNFLLLCSNTDKNFKNTQISVLAISPKGKLISQKGIDQENIYNIIKVIPVGTGNYKIYANTTLNKSLSPLSLNIDDIQQVTSKYNSKAVYSTYISDVYGLNKNTGLILYTRKTKDNFYGINLNKENTANNKVEWLKNISTSTNEEANKIVVSHNDDIFVLAKDYEENLNEYSPKLYKLNELGNLVWEKVIDVPSNFYRHCISVNKQGNVVYACGYTRNQTGSAETRIITLDDNGEIKNTTNIKDFSANGILKLSNGNFLLYGSTFYIDMRQVVTKGKFVILNEDMQIISNQALTKTDKPDIDLKSEKATSSEMFTAYELSDDRIAIGGKVYMPNENNEEFNQPLLIICSPEGEFR